MPAPIVRALVWLAVDLDDAADTLDVRANDVHADAPPGDRRDFLGGRKPRLEDQGKLLPGAEVGRIGLLDHSGCDRLFHKLLAVDPAAVVLDVDQDLISGLARRNGQKADLALAGLEPVGRKFDPMIDRVANDVRQRVADHLDHLAIELDVAAFDVDEDLLAELRGKVADHARQCDEQVFDALHARAGDGIAHFGDDRGQPLERAVDRDLARRFAESARQLVAGEHHVGNAAHQTVEQLDRKADRARRSGLALRLGDGGGHRGDLNVRALLKRLDQGAVFPGGEFLARVERGDHLGDPVDDRQDRTDEGGVGLAASGADLGERVFGGVAQRFQARKIEEAAIAFDGVHEAENGIEPRTVVRRCFPGDDLAAERL